MDVQLQELIDKIKIEGVEQAREKSERMVAEAKQAADQIRADAEAEARSIKERATLEAEASLRAGNDALSQAGRDLLLGLKREIESLFTRVIEEETAVTLSGDVLEQAILKVFDSLLSDEAESAELILPPEDVPKLASALKSKLAAKVKGGVPITPSNRVSSGFRVTVENGAAFYDFTPTQIASVLSAFLNPTIAELITGQSNPGT